ncbi:MAG: adenosylcobalamin-dependent ribonucleoside-diphosphate reductase [Methylobacteriaceae bacterium]|nr:adenosylcobalamin-dependent ribonucleoside-diphosphate reductase [Methylobacteriaceae bacterium]
MNRVAFAMADGHDHYHDFREVLLDMRFMPGGRIQAAMGAAKKVTPYNCFVASKIDDSFVEGDNSIMGVATQAAQTMRMGGGIGYDFSTLRPSGALIKKLGSRSSGPMAFMNIFNEVCKATSSAGNRRGAQMGVLRVDHPDIVAFVHAKNNLDKLNGFNISVAVTDEFMEAVDKQSSFELKFGGRVYDEIDALELYEMMMRSTWDWAEPGILFIDTINRMNNLWYCEEIAATNPCGEQPLAPNAACLLGSFNLVRYIRKDKQTGLYYFDFDQLKADIPHVVRAMNMVIDRAIYPLQAQMDAAHAKRRMGLGVTGVANAIETLGFPYGTPDYIAMQGTILKVIEHGAYMASIDLAKEKGPFPLFDAEKYLAGEYIKTLPEDVRAGIAKHGILNSHLLSIAPTGTISQTADNVSSSIEPVFEEVTQRPVFMAEGKIIVSEPDYAFAQFGTKPKISDHVSLDEHLGVLLNATKHVDSAVSKTCNTAGDFTPWDDFKALYRRAWEGGAKGVTTFNKDGKRLALLTKGTIKSVAKVEEEVDQTEKQVEACEFDAATGRRSCE